MVLAVHAPVICLVEDLMAACGKRADDTLCLLAPTRRWCCQQPKKNEGSHFCYVTKQTLKSQKLLCNKKMWCRTIRLSKLRARTRFRTRTTKYTCRVKRRASGLSTSTKKRSFFILLEQKQHVIDRYRTHLHKSTVPSKWLTFHFSSGRKSGLILNEVSFHAYKLKPNTSFVHTFLRSSSFSIGSTAQHGLAVSV